MKSSEGTRRHLTVIGAGPKAVALAAKRHVLQDLGLEVPDLAVFDREGIAANWAGDHGYTNGHLRLGTAPEKDVGFPYASDRYDPVQNREVNQAMLNYSWLVHKVTERSGSYAEWIDRGRPMPAHRQWARYLEWVAGLVKLSVQPGELAAIELAEGRWRVAFDGGETVETDGLVITSPGPPKEKIERRGAAAHAVLNGKDYWAPAGQARVRDLARATSRVCVIGSGETAAAIVVHLAKELRHPTIEVISRDGVIFTRGESFEENRLFSDPRDWEGFDAEVREKFVGRTDRGVFSATCKAAIDDCEFIETIGGAAKSIDLEDEKLWVETSRGRCGPYDLVVDATGFRRDWFLEKMDEAALHALEIALPQIETAAAKEGSPAKRLEERLELAIDWGLEVRGLEPMLHLPMFAALEQGPGFPSLGCLGILSDRILITHHEAMAESEIRVERTDRPSPAEASESGDEDRPGERQVEPSGVGGDQ
jgi:mycobactin lysine-N-oxygenase